LPVNVGTGNDIAIAELAALVADVIGFEGAITRDESKPDGTPRKLMDSGRLEALGWTAQTALRAGIADAYRHFMMGSG
jgi:GDP-L-fucose synthase